MPIVLDGLDGLREHAGSHLGYSGWIEVTQDRVDEFAHATGDTQWIHVDVQRAARDSPYGSTIAHGFLTLSVIPGLQHEIFRIRGAKLGVNYGAEKIRFPAAVPVGSRVRLGAALHAVEAAPGGAVQVHWAFTVEVAGGAKPACVAELVFRYFF
jgi:acyl dehydratase